MVAGKLFVVALLRFGQTLQNGFDPVEATAAVSFGHGSRLSIQTGKGLDIALLFCILELYIIVRRKHTLETSVQPTIRIDADSATPAYRQIADSIRALLVEGVLNPEDVLPPVRQLAIDLAVHFNTVAEAYRMLADEGWLDLKRRLGARVIARPMPQPVSPESKPKFAKRLQELVAATRAEGVPTDVIAQTLRRIAEALTS